MLTASLSRHAYCVQALLEAYPAAAAMAVPTKWNTKRSPFLQAIAAGCFWHSTSMAALKCTTTGTNKGPLHYLWQAHPEDLSRVDPVTGLYPVLLAANHYLGTDPITNETSQLELQQHILKVDTIYNLLRLHPQILEEASA